MRVLAGLLFCVTGALVTVPHPVLAQSYPSRPIRVIVPYAPGGGSDILARAFTRKPGEELGQPFVVDNRPGAGAVIGTQAVATAAPDGYTLGFFDSSFTINPGLQKDKLPYDPVRDFAPITLVATTPFLLVVHPSVPARNVNELLDYARKNPGKLNYASAGYGTGTNLVGEQMKLVTGVDIVHVGYKGAGPGITALIAGEVQMTFATPSSIAAHIKAGKVVPLAVMAPSRLSAFPDVPTAVESGMPAGVEFSSIWGFFAPAGTPESVLNLLAKVFTTHARDPAGQRQIRDLGFEPAGTGREEFTAFVRKETERLRDVIERAGIKPQ